MQYVQSSTSADGIARVAIRRGRVNALNPELIAELDAALGPLRDDEKVRAVILTGSGSFFSFGFDVPEFMDYSREAFTEYLRQFTAFYTDLFAFPKPVIASINGHAVAGGCMLVTACDERIMVTGRALIGLNEVAFGASVFAGYVEMLKHVIGARNAERLLLSGDLVSAESAATLGLVDEVCAPDALEDRAEHAASRYAAHDPAAFRSIKQLLRGPILERMRQREAASIHEFVELWYAPAMRERLREITIKS